MPMSNIEAVSYIVVHLHKDRFTDVFTSDEMIQAAKRLKTDIAQPVGIRSELFVKRSLVKMEQNELIEFIDGDRDRFRLTDSGKERIKEVREEYPFPPADEVDTAGPGVQRTPKRATAARKSISASPREVMKRARCYRRKLTMSPDEIIEARNAVIAKLEQKLLAAGAIPNPDNGDGMEVDGDTSAADTTMVSQSPFSPQVNPDSDMPDLEHDLSSSDADDTSSVIQPDSDWEHDNDNGNDDTAVQVAPNWLSTSTPPRRSASFDPDRTLVNSSKGKGKQRALVHAAAAAATANAGDAKQVFGLIQDVEELEERLKKKENELDAARKEKGAARGDYETLQKTFDTSTRRWASSLFRTWAMLVLSRESARAQNEQHATTIDTLEREVAALSAELAKCRAQMEQLTTMYEGLATENGKLVTQNVHLTTGYQQLTIQNTELTTTNGQLTTTNEQLTAANGQLKDKIEKDATVVSSLFAGMTNMMQGAASKLNVS